MNWTLDTFGKNSTWHWLCRVLIPSCQFHIFEQVSAFGKAHPAGYVHLCSLLRVLPSCTFLTCALASSIAFTDTDLLNGPVGSGSPSSSHFLTDSGETRLKYFHNDITTQAAVLKYHMSITFNFGREKIWRIVSAEFAKFKLAPNFKATSLNYSKFY